MNPEVAGANPSSSRQFSPTDLTTAALPPRAGEPFRHFVEAASPALRALARRMTGDSDAAEDILQESFLALLKQPDFSPDHPAAYAYASTTVRNRCVDYHRLLARRGDLIRGVAGPESDILIEWALPRDEVTPHDILVTREKMEAGMQIPGTLRSDHARLLRDKLLEGGTNIDVAGEGTTSKGTVRSRYHSAKAHFVDAARIRSLLHLFQDYYLDHGW